MDEITFRQVHTPQEKEEIFSLREKVFAEEQGIPAELDRDGKDETALHLIAMHRQKVIATGRLHANHGNGHLSRIAVDKNFRGRGIAKELVCRLLEEAKLLDLNYLYLLPHAHLEAFYQSLGFSKVNGYLQILAGHEIIKMEMKLN